MSLFHPRAKDVNWKRAMIGKRQGLSHQLSPISQCRYQKRPVNRGWEVSVKTVFRLNCKGRSNNLPNRVFTDVQLRWTLNLLCLQPNPGPVRHTPHIGLIKQTKAENAYCFCLIGKCSQRTLDWHRGG